MNTYMKAAIAFGAFSLFADSVTTIYALNFIRGAVETSEIVKIFTDVSPFLVFIPGLIALSAMCTIAYILTELASQYDSAALSAMPASFSIAVIYLTSFSAATQNALNIVRYTT